MTSEIDIFRSAPVLIGRHGDQALCEAYQQLDKFVAAGDLAAAAIWVRISNALQTITSTSRRSSTAH